MEIFNLPDIGEVLSQEHTFYELGYDRILFVCRDYHGRRYLCSQCTLGERLVVTTVTPQTLLSLMNGQITIREVFELPDEFRFTITRGGPRDGFIRGISSELLPMTGVKLELPAERRGEYYQRLLKECPHAEAPQTAARNNTNRYIHPISMNLLRQLMFDIAMEMTDNGRADYDGPNRELADKLLDLSNATVLVPASKTAAKASDMVWPENLPVVSSTEPDLVFFESTHQEDEEDLKCEGGNMWGRIYIDGFPEDENKGGSVVATVTITSHGDIVIDWHHNGYRGNETVNELIQESIDTLKWLWAEENQ